VPIASQTRIKKKLWSEPASYPMGIGAVSLAIKRTERETDHSLLSGAKEKNGGYISPLPHKSSWRDG
jgi:hypothetical protein